MSKTAMMFVSTALWYNSRFFDTRAKSCLMTFGWSEFHRKLLQVTILLRRMHKCQAIFSLQRVWCGHKHNHYQANCVWTSHDTMMTFLLRTALSGREEIRAFYSTYDTACRSYRLLQVRLQCTTSALLCWILLYKYRALTDCTTAAHFIFLNARVFTCIQEITAYKHAKVTLVQMVHSEWIWSKHDRFRDWLHRFAHAVTPTVNHQRSSI